MIPSLENLGKWIFFIGFGLCILGGILWALARLFGWENFPGNLRFQFGNLTCIIPILGSIILSIILTLLLNFLARFLNR